MSKFLNTDLDTTLGGLTPSDEKVSSQKAIKTYIDTEVSSKQDTLVSGTNIKTINNTSLLGSGNITIDGLPDQTNQSGKILTTNGTDPSWADIPTEIPSQAGNSGKFLKTDGTAVSWARGVENLSLQTDGLTVFGTPSNTGSGTINIGPGTSSIYGGIAIGLNAQAVGNRGVAIAEDTSAASTAVAIGYNAKATATNAVQLGAGTNTNAGTLQFKSYQLLDTSGMIPEARLASTGSAVQGQALVLDSGLDAKWTTLKVSDLTDDSDFATVTFRAWGAGE